MEEPTVTHAIDDSFEVLAEGFWPSWDELRIVSRDGALVATGVDPQVTVNFEVPITRLGLAITCPDAYEGERFTVYYSEESPPAFDEAKSQTLNVRRGSSLYLLRFDGLVHHLRIDPMEKQGPTGISRIVVMAGRDEEQVRVELSRIAEQANEAQLKTIDVVMDPDHRDALSAYSTTALRAEGRARSRMRRQRGAAGPQSVEVVFDPQPNYVDPDVPLLKDDVTAIVDELFGVEPTIHTGSIGESTTEGLLLCIEQTALSAAMERVHWDLPQDLKELRNLCFLSAGSAALGLPGAHGYAPSRKTRALLRLLFERPWRHGVRDAFTAELLESAGVTNFEIVGTPSLWDIPDGLGATIPTGQGERVLFAADEYFHDPKNDVATLKRLLKLYDEVALWPRNAPEPVEYAKRIIRLARPGDVVEGSGKSSLPSRLATPSGPSANQPTRANQSAQSGSSKRKGRGRQKGRAQAAKGAAAQGRAAHPARGRKRRANVIILAPGPESLDAYLSVPGTDYVGPNLEAGIRALKAGRRTLILTSDDRSTGVVELAHLPAIRRIEVADVLEEWILTSHEVKLRIPRKAIAAWKAQFSTPAS